MGYQEEFWHTCVLYDTYVSYAVFFSNVRMKTFLLDVWNVEAMLITYSYPIFYRHPLTILHSLFLSPLGIAIHNGVQKKLRKCLWGASIASRTLDSDWGIIYGVGSFTDTIVFLESVVAVFVYRVLWMSWEASPVQFTSPCFPGNLCSVELLGRITGLVKISHTIPLFNPLGC